jgi:hypothetical protein
MSMIKCWLSNSFAVFMLFLASGSCFAQVETVTISGQIKDSATHLSLPYVTAVLKMISDSSMVSGSVTNEEGRFSLSNVKPGEYYLQASFVGYGEYWQRLYVGRLSEFLDLGVIEMQESLQMLNEVEITAKRDEVGRQLTRKPLMWMPM